MGTIRSTQQAMGYAAPAPRGVPRCEACRHQTWAATARGNRLPYCRQGGFFIWLDAGCVAGFSRRQEGSHG